jgi:uncharacterized protein
MLGQMAGYHEGSRAWQEAFDSCRLADRLDERFRSKAAISEDQKAFIEGLDLFFLATADAEGRPQCSYKGGDPGFVRVLDPQTLAFPSFDGNGMYLSLGNISVNPHVGLLFVDFGSPRRLRVNGIAAADAADPLLASWPRAQAVVRVAVTEVFPNCSRYVHRMELVERSRFVPRSDAEPPVPDWKRSDWARDVLPREMP